MNKNKGFTLIELLVVIAIIGILSGIVLTSLSTARGKANDSKIKAQLSSMRAAAEMYYTTNNNYGAMAALNAVACTGGAFSDASSGMVGLVTASNYPGGAAPTCATDANPATKWAAWHALSSDSTKGFCVDSTGAAKDVVLSGTGAWTAPSSSSAVCP